jgi:AmmeMemoRadiSam system protein B
MFYPADPQACRQRAASFVRALGDSGTGWLGGIVPHAGWDYSGAIAGQTIGTLAAAMGSAVDVVVVFGAVHTLIPIATAALDPNARWLMPGGAFELPGELERKLTESGELFHVDERFHAREHAVEVELPLIREAWPSAAVLPIEVPAVKDAIEIGRRAAQEIQAANLRAVFLASSDLTHYGLAYDFAPAGIGQAGLAWAKANDRRLLDRVVAMDVDAVVPEARGHFNACGGGAIAAMMAACQACGAREGRILQHANSYETTPTGAPRVEHSAVGYAAVVIGGR